VTEAANGAQALDLLGDGSFDVMITDITLPGIPGDELARRAIERQPGLRIVFASGYAVRPEAGDRDPLRRAIMLQKPYNTQKLIDAVNAAMAPAAGVAGGGAS
jgi:CheY-like chemotaxis protein